MKNNITGLIFDIQRGSLYDGPGIRTTVFLKGCPLRCLHCHNPESVYHSPELSFDERKCTLCGVCVVACKDQVHHIKGKRHTLDRDRCRVCGKCAAACVSEALAVIGAETDARTVISEVEKDLDYYRSSGGGLTLSGGEPMMQAEFTLELLRLAREHNIHTCIETCGFAPRERYAAALPLVDLFLFDIKGTDRKKHRALTGVPNDLILSNLDFLYAKGTRIVLRCPLVPGVNDDPDHLAGIAALSKRYPKLGGIELMAYHGMGKDKAAKIGRKYALHDLRTAGEDVKARWLSTLKGLGCDRAVIG